MDEDPDEFEDSQTVIQDGKAKDSSSRAGKENESNLVDDILYSSEDDRVTLSGSESESTIDETYRSGAKRRKEIFDD